MNKASAERRALRQQLMKGLLLRARDAGVRRSTKKIKAEMRVMIDRSMAQQARKEV